MTILRLRVSTLEGLSRTWEPYGYLRTLSVAAFIESKIGLHGHSLPLPRITSVRAQSVLNV